jgi:hypothetical protein
MRSQSAIETGFKTTVNFKDGADEKGDELCK